MHLHMPYCDSENISHVSTNTDINEILYFLFNFQKYYNDSLKKKMFLLKNVKILLYFYFFSILKFILLYTLYCIRKLQVLVKCTIPVLTSVKMFVLTRTKK